jgi:N-acetylmuramic acid 6-phosphate etherase
MSVQELLTNINQEDQTVPLAVEKALPQIETLVTEIVAKVSMIVIGILLTYILKF